MSASQSGLARELAEWIAQSRSGLDDENVLYWTKQGLLDYLGVTLAASDSEESSVVSGYLADDDQWREGGSPVIGLGGFATPSAAAFANGVLGHIHDFDDLSDTMVGHPSVATLPALLAASSSQEVSGRDLLDAYLVAFEVASKMGLAFNYTQTEKGWHTTATLGIFGAVAGVCRLARSSPDVIANALGIAASFAAGLKVNFGTLTKPLHVGRASQSGLAAARLAERGAHSRPDVFEYEQGYAMVFNGEGNFDLGAMRGKLGNPWEMIEPGIAFKLYPSCGSTHSAIDVALEARNELESAADVASVVIYLHPRRLATVNRPAPRSRLDRKFSVQYTVALALVQGAVRLRDFTDSEEPPREVEEMLSRVSARAMPESRWGPEHFAAEIELETRSGQRIEKRVEKARGRGPRLAAREEERLDKFRHCANGALTNEEVETVIATVSDFENKTPAEVKILLDSLIGKGSAPTSG